MSNKDSSLNEDQENVETKDINMNNDKKKESGINKSQVAFYKFQIDELKEHLEKEEKITLSYFTLHFNPFISQLAIDLISKKHNLSENWKEKHKILTGTEEHKIRKAVESSIYALKLKHLDVKLSGIQLQLKDSPEDVEQITKTYAKYLQVRKQIAEKLGRTMC